MQGKRATDAEKAATMRPRTTKTINLAVASMVALAAMGAIIVPTVGASNNCSDSNTGWGTEPVSCDDVSCLEGEMFLVDIKASNNNDDVEAEGGCDTAETECESSNGQCAKWSTTRTTTASHGGECSGSAEVGRHGSVDLYCESGSSENDDLAFGVLRQALALGDCAAVLGESQIMASFAVHMHWSDGLLQTTSYSQGECKSSVEILALDDGWVNLRF